MNQNQLFNQTRLRLACWYAGVMGVILSLCGLGVYEAIAHAHWMTLDGEMYSIAGTLHDSLVPLLKQPGRLEKNVWRLLPELCVLDEKIEQICIKDRAKNEGENQAIGAIHQGNYYVRLLDKSGEAIAVGGSLPEPLPPTTDLKLWHRFTDGTNTRYSQISVVLHTQDRREWGYLQLGRSLQDFDDYLSAVKIILLLGLPIALLLVGIASWVLAGFAMQPIYHSYHQIQQFTADAAHELRTPLAAIRATVESILRMPELTLKEAIETLKTVDRQNLRLSQLVNDLLLLSRMDRQALPVKREICCLNDTIADVEEEIAALAIAAHVTLKTEIRVKEPVEIMGNEEQLYRLVFNLVVNAIQYTPSEGTVTVILDRSDRYASIQVKDTGVGIPATDLLRIFDRFYRVNSDRSRNSGGSGLGLSIAKAIAERHDGSIQVQSHLDRGSLFTVRLSILEASMQQSKPRQ